MRRYVHELSPREKEILALVAEGLSDKDIANRLIIGERTVRTHVSIVLHKLGVKNRTAATLFYLRDYSLRPSDDVLAAIGQLVRAVRGSDIAGFLRAEVDTAEQWVKEWGN